MHVKNHMIFLLLLVCRSYQTKMCQPLIGLKSSTLCKLDKPSINCQYAAQRVIHRLQYKKGKMKRDSRFHFLQLDIIITYKHRSIEHKAEQKACA